MAAAANVGHKIMIRGKKEVKSVVVVVTGDGDRPPDIGQRQQLKTSFSNKSRVRREAWGACIHDVFTRF